MILEDCRQMCEQIDSLMMLSEMSIPSERRSGYPNEPDVLTLADSDDIEAYCMVFERII